MRARYDVVRSALALAAAALAFTGYVAATRFQVMDGWEWLSWVMVGEAAFALLLAVAPLGRRWSPGRRALAGVVATMLLVLALPMGLSGTAVPGCACVDPFAAPAYVGPLILGAPHLMWVLAGLFGSPTLMLTAALIGRRSARVDQPPAPGASSAAESGPPASNN